jgi:hypothetical protein
MKTIKHVYPRFPFSTLSTSFAMLVSKTKEEGAMLSLAEAKAFCSVML